VVHRKICPYAIKKIPRVKDAKDWLLTWSPEEDALDLPEDLKSIIRTWPISRLLLVAEKEQKWHVHCLFSTSRSYNSDYKWWAADLKDKAYGAALDIRYHNNFLVCAGGYMSKDYERKILKVYNVTQAQMEYGAEEYNKRLVRQKIRRNLDDFVVIQPDKFDAAVGALQAERGYDRAEAEIRLGEYGFCFARSSSGHTELYRRMYLRQKEVSALPNERESLSL